MWLRVLFYKANFILKSSFLKYSCSESCVKCVCLCFTCVLWRPEQDVVSLLLFTSFLCYGLSLSGSWRLCPSRRTGEQAVRVCLFCVQDCWGICGQAWFLVCDPDTNSVFMLAEQSLLSSGLSLLPNKYLRKQDFNRKLGGSQKRG